MLWQTPIISLTAQAFLFQIALGGGCVTGKVLAASLAFLSALASSHLLAKQRYLKIYYAQKLESLENSKGWPVIHDRPPRPDDIRKLSSYKIWQIVFLSFAAAAIISIWLAIRA